MGQISSSEYAIDHRLSRLRWKPGFWHAMLPQKHLSAYLQIGVFPADGEGPFIYPEDALDCLKGNRFPVLWQDLQHPQSPNVDSWETLASAPNG